MKKIFLATALFIGVLSGCHKNIITGRSQLALVSENEAQAMALQQYKQFLSESKVIPPGTSRDQEMVTRAGKRIAAAITDHYTKNGAGEALAGYNWEFNLVDSKEVNAWCMPGGKVVVYTGILPYTQNEAGLAVVMGHEIAHAVARHGSERMSQGLLQQLGGVALSVALANKPQETQMLWNTAYGVGSTVFGILPFSRSNELEADKFGLIFSSLAGYNPDEAVPFWQRMSKAGGGQKPPEFLSTHPSDETRITKVRQYAEEAKKYYKGGK